MQKLTFRALCITVLACLAGCASTGATDLVRVGNGIVFRLLSPGSLGQQVILTQVVTLSYEDESQQLLFFSEVSAQAVTIAGLLPDGSRLFSIHYDGVSLRSEGNGDVLERLDPHYLLADMQMALWPLAAVRGSLASANGCFASGTCKLLETVDQRQRTLSREGDIIVDIRYQDIPAYRATLAYEHRARGYSLQIETVNVEPSAPPAQQESEGQRRP